MPLTGDFSALNKLASTLDKLGSVPERATARVAEEIRTLIEQEFDTQSDPHGNAWKEHADATVERWGPHKILDLSGDMKRTLHVEPMPGSVVRVTMDDPARAHQTGWSGPQGKGPARPIVPEGANIPQSWENAIKTAVDAAIEEATK